MKTLRSVATHTLVFFVGYWLAGGLDYSPRRNPDEKRISDVERVIRGYEDRISLLEKKLGSSEGRENYGR